MKTAVSYVSTSTFKTYAGQCFNVGCDITDHTCSSVSLGTSNLAPLGVDDGAQILYARVEEINPTVGKTVYNYTGEDLIKKEVYTEGLPTSRCL